MDTITVVPVPTAADLKKMLFELVDKPITCTESPLAPEAGGTYLAVYQGRDGAPLAILVADLTFAASSAAALAMMPPRLVEEAKKEGALPSSLLDVFHEEPLPTVSPLWSHPKVRMTSHTSFAGSGAPSVTPGLRGGGQVLAAVNLFVPPAPSRKGSKTLRYKFAVMRERAVV